jgi:hypothetical protein
LLQTTNTTPRRRTILQLSQIRLILARIFIAVALTFEQQLAETAEQVLAGSTIESE